MKISEVTIHISAGIQSEAAAHKKDDGTMEEFKVVLFPTQRSKLFFVSLQNRLNHPKPSINHIQRIMARRKATTALRCSALRSRDEDRFISALYATMS